MRNAQKARVSIVVMMFCMMIVVCLVGVASGQHTKAIAARIEDIIEVPQDELFAEYGNLEIASGGVLCIAGSLEMPAGSKLTVKEGGTLKLCGADTNMSLFAAELVIEGLVEIENFEWDNFNIKVTVKKTGVLRLVCSSLKTLTSPILLDGGRLEITRFGGSSGNNSYIICSGCYAVEATNAASIYIGDNCGTRRVRTATELAEGGRYDKVILLQAGSAISGDGISYKFDEDAYLSGEKVERGSDAWNRINGINASTNPEIFDARRVDNDQSLIYLPPTLPTTLALTTTNNDGLGGNSGIKTYNKQAMQVDAAIDNPKSDTTYIYNWYRYEGGIMQQLDNDGTYLIIRNAAESGLYKCAISDGAETIDECEVELSILPKLASLVWTDTDTIYNGLLQQPFVEVTNIEDGDECSVTISGGGIAAGSYIAKAVSISNNNYVLPEVAECQLTILAKPVSGFAIVGDYYYSGLPQDIAVVCTETSEDYTLTLSNADSIIDADSYIIEVVGISNGNYTIAEPIELTVSVLPRQLTYTISGGNTSVYGEPLQSGSLLQGCIISDTKEAVLDEAGIYLYIDGNPTQGASVGRYRIKGGWRNSNYSVIFEEDDYNITPREIEVSYGAIGNFVFDNNIHYIDILVSNLYEGDSVTLVYQSGKDVSYSDGKIAAVGAGSYSITFTAIDGNNNYTLKAAQPLCFQIAKAVIGIAFEGTDNLVYNGLPKDVFAMPKHTIIGIDCSLKVVLDMDGITVANAVAAGQYTLTAMFDTPDGQHDCYMLPDEGCSVTFAIDKCQLTAAIYSASSVYGEGISPLTYNLIGEIAAGDKLDIALTKARGCDVGGYDIVGSWNGNTNYCLAFANQNNAYTITARPLCLSIDEKLSVYGDSKEPLSYTITSGSVVADDDIGIIFEIERQDSFVAGLAGIYNITAAASNTNYAISINQAVYTILPRQIRVEIDRVYIVYGEPIPAFSATVFNAMPYDVLQIELCSTGINTGTYDITVVCGNLNYTIVESDGKDALCIAPKDLELVFEGVQDSIYNGQAADISVCTVGQVEGDAVEVAYIIYSVCNNAKKIVTQAKDAGCYEVGIISIDASSNYNIPTLISKSFVITAAPIEYIIDNQTSVFGSPIPTLTGKVKDGYTVFANDELGIALQTSGKDVGTYAIIGTAANPNYQVTFWAAIHTIIQRELSLIFIGHNTNGQDRVYKNMPLDIYIDVSNAVSGDNIYFDPTKTTLMRNGMQAQAVSVGMDSISIMDFAGDYVLRVGGLMGMGDNYCFSPTELHYTIQRRQLTVSFAGCDGLVYNGNPHNIEAMLGNIATNDSVNAVYEGISGTNAGSYTARVASIDNPNYLLPQYSRNYVIGKALPRISVTQGRYEFVQDIQDSYFLQASADNGMPIQFFVADGARLIPTQNAFGKTAGEYTIILTTQETANYQAAIPVEVVVVVLSTHYSNNNAGQDVTLILSGGGQPNAAFVASILDTSPLGYKYLPVYRSKAVKYVCDAKLVEGNTVLDISNAEVRLKLPESLQNQQEITIMYNENGAIIYKTVAVNNGYIVFDMQALGEFALLQDEDIAAAAHNNLNGKFILSVINATTITIFVVLLIIVIRKKLYKT